MLQNNSGGDVAPAYLASLPTTSAVLTALRSANTAKLNMMAGAKPVQHDSVDLVQLLGQGEVPSYCTEACVSPSGLHMAVCLGTIGSDYPHGHGHEYAGVWEPYTSPPPGVRFRKALMMFSLEQGIDRAWSLGDLCRNPVIKWSSDSRLLSVVMLLAVARPEGDSARPEVFHVVVLDVQGNVVYQLGHNTTCYLWFYLCQEGYTEFEWSPSGQFLLVTSRSSLERHGGQDTGCLTVFDVQGGGVVDRISLLAQSEISVSVLVERMSPAAWHPGSHCIVVSSGIELKASERFAAAGLVLGRLPDRHFIPVQGSARFSFDGQYLMAVHQDYACPDSDESLADALFTENSCKFTVLRCTLSGTDVLLEPIHSDKMAPASHTMDCSAWAPYSPSLMCSLSDVDNTIILDFAQQPSHPAEVYHRTVALEGKTCTFNACFALSGQIVVTNSGRIFRSDTGKLLRAKSDHFSEEVTGRVTQFLPSGRGLICVRQRAVQLTPTLTSCVLHVLSFA